ncbi:glutathione-disulfide reductase [Phreatobacter oligotrophus]|uniref:glutathione-disulfide reductase n=1 Tax=Phreatobacter oligotrophus TaxID=1122261 RepID=UPI0023532CD6|nr:glutathione-disulfide reductase [Phreatobacter oligotrophus]MBX9990014.1 glutathione-disulfide reductase [Phreatobacter oligotrophus]
MSSAADPRFDVDLFVIGGGSGGVRAARIAATHGARVMVAEEYRMGGTCVIRGCVPKKLMVYASQFHEHFEDAAGFGWTVGETSFDWPRFIAAKDREISRLEGIYGTNLTKAGVEIVAQRATVAGPNAVTLADGRTITAKYILIATGGRPSTDETLPGREHTISSNEVFHLPEQPKRIVIAGGGYIAVEFAGVFAGLGSEVTLVYRGDKVLRGFDEDVRDHLMAEYQKKGIRLVMGEVFTGIEKGADGLTVSFRNGHAPVVADQVLMAIGRKPNTAGLGLEAAGVKLGKSGEVLVDADSRTSVPSIYAVGDVTDRVNLTPVAIREGHAFADTVFGGKAWTADHQLIPTAVFSEPEIGTVGLSEAEALATGCALDVYKATFRPMKHTISGRDTRMLMKLLVDGETDRVLGVHVCGPDAGEMIQLAGIAVKMGATKADFDSTMAVHPTAAEELVTMRTPSHRHPKAPKAA